MGRQCRDIRSMVRMVVMLAAVAELGPACSSNDPIPLASDSGTDATPDLALATGGDGPVDLSPASEGLVSSDGEICADPKVWRYEEPGCGAEAHPICSFGGGDACLAFACGCDGETLTGCDYFTKPWRARGLCPDACYGPTMNLAAIGGLVGIMKGCPCDSTKDASQCVSIGGGYYTIDCAQDTWSLDWSRPCADVDAGPTDASLIDGGTPDAGPSDAGQIDGVDIRFDTPPDDGSHTMTVDAPPPVF
jgi:hypothetical protein